MTQNLLTTREMEVFTILAEGLTNKEIALRLGLVEATVKVHLRTINKKLGTKNRVQLAVMAAKPQAHVA